MNIRKGDRYMSTEQVTFAEYLLKDGASYKEVGRTIGFSDHSVRERFPGHGWTPAKGGKFARMLGKRGALA